MKFSEFRKYQPKGSQNVFVFVCEDDFLVEESRAVWKRIFTGEWLFEKFTAKEFEEIPSSRLMDDALTPSLFSSNRAFIVTNAGKVTKDRLEDLARIRDIPNASLKVILVLSERRSSDALFKTFPAIEIDQLRPADVARWLTERYKLDPDIARYLVDAVGLDLQQLHTEVEKLQTYAGGARPVEVRDVDVLILRSEASAPFELEDAIIARDYKKAIQVLSVMMDEGAEPIMILGRIVRVWRQLFIGKGLAGKRSAGAAAAAAGTPAFKANEFVAGCRKYEWRQLATGFTELLNADRAFKSSTPNPEGYFAVMLWKLMA